MQRRLQGFCGSAREWYRDNVLANVPQTDTEKIEFVHASDYGDQGDYYGGEQNSQFANYQTYDQQEGGQPDQGNGFTNANGTYAASKFGEYEEFSDSHGMSSQRISEWQAGWNVTNAIQVNLD